MNKKEARPFSGVPLLFLRLKIPLLAFSPAISDIHRMKFATPVEIPAVPLRIRPTDKLSFVGSCFAQHIGNKVLHASLDTHVNPFGILYNPLSISLVLNAMLRRNPLPDSLFFSADGLFNCYLFDSSFASPSLDDCRARIARTLSDEAARLSRTNFLFLTLGTNRYYILKENRQPVGNCHKLPAALFEEKQLSIDEIVRALDLSLNSLQEINPNLKVVFTVSPYRYAKYGFHQSRLGKAVLLLAVDQICRDRPNCSYFPAYEILLDELRDYRFYAPDLLHPSETAVDFIYERFSDAYFSEETKHLARQWGEIERAASHRPLHPLSDARRQFLNRTTNKLQLLIKQYPHLISVPAYKLILSKLQT